jgi:HEAT repeat protein
VADVERLLADGDPQIRITAFRALRQVRPDVLAESRRLAADPSPAVRREVALALRDVPFEQSGDLLVALAAGYDGQDRWYLEALGIGASGKEEALYAALTSSRIGPTR